MLEIRLLRWCSKSFFDCSNLRQHKLVYTGEKPHDRSFLTKSGIKLAQVAASKSAIRWYDRVAHMQAQMG